MIESKGLSIGISDDPYGVPELLDKVHTHANPQIHNDPLDPDLNPRRKRVRICSKNDMSSDFEVALRDSWTARFGNRSVRVGPIGFGVRSDFQKLICPGPIGFGP